MLHHHSLTLPFLFGVLVVASVSGTAHAQATQSAYFKASHPDAGDRFGGKLALSGDTLVVGAPHEDSSDTGISIDTGDNSSNNTGAVYVFVRGESGWRQQAYLKASNAEPIDFFGSAVAICGDTIVVSAQGEDSGASGVDGDQGDNSMSFSGAAYVFVRTGTTWSQQAYLKASNPDPDDAFGGSVAISGDTIAVSATGEDSSHGGIDGPPNNNSYPFAGAVYVFVRQGETWSQQAYLKAQHPGLSDSFGRSLSLSGDRLLIGAPGEDSIAVGVNGPQTINSAQYAGAAYLFVRNGAVWSQDTYFKAHNTDAFDEYGVAVALSGDLVAVAARNEDGGSTGINGDGSDNSGDNPGACYVYSRGATAWVQEAYVKAQVAGARFGWNLALDGNVLLAVGRVSEDGPAAIAYTDFVQPLTRHDGTWTMHDPFRPLNVEIDDVIVGNTVYQLAIEGSTAVIGVEGEDGGSSGVNGDQQDNSAADSGAAFTFELGTFEGSVGESLCNGDGGDQQGCTDCPCSNNAVIGTVGGCINSFGNSARLIAGGSLSVSLPPADDTDLRFELSGAPAMACAVLLSGNAVAPSSPQSSCFGLSSGVQAVDRAGLRCIVQGIRRHGNRVSDGVGSITATEGSSRVWGGPARPEAGITGQAGFVAGQTRYFQATYRDDPLLGPCADASRGLNTSQAVRVVFEP